MSTKPTVRLRRPLPLDPAQFFEITKDLTSTEIGALVILALEWWPDAVLPSRPADLGRVLGIDPHAAKKMADRLAPRLAYDSELGILRAAHVSKANRRARAGRAGMASRWSHLSHA